MKGPCSTRGLHPAFAPSGIRAEATGVQQLVDGGGGRDASGLHLPGPADDTVGLDDDQQQEECRVTTRWPRQQGQGSSAPMPA